MKILVTVSCIGKNAAGIAFERLLYGLSLEGHNIHVITEENNQTLKYKANNRVVPVRYLLPKRIQKLFIILLHIDLLKPFWIKKAMRIEKQHSMKPDIVLALGNGGGFSSIVLAKKLAKKYSVPLAIHLVDAIPSPKPWGEISLYRIGLEKIITKLIAEADGYSASNVEMMNYQLSFLSKNKPEHTVVYIPLIETKKEFKHAAPNLTFVFLGSLYGVRSPKSLIEGFKFFLKINPEATLLFVGNSVINWDEYNLMPHEMQQIKKIPWTNNVDKYLEQATALIDIDANFDNDVFLSSKLISYLAANRFIISITGENSPARNLLSSLTKSVVICHHNEHEVFEAMKKISLETFTDDFFAERSVLLEELDIAKVAKKLSAHLEKTIINNDQ